jgi:sulfatase maturation enzyme AslB (radical SAM superfamily)
MYSRENDELAESLFHRTFGLNWKIQGGNENMKRIELMLTPVCNLGCRYCYIHKHGNDLYSKEIRDRQTILNNLKIVLNWLIENNYRPGIDLFSGDPLTQRIGIEALEMILDRYREVPPDRRITSISIPTNFTFILSNDLTEQVEFLINEFDKIGIRVSLSASIDGKILENMNRPLLLNGRRAELLEESLLPPMTAEECKAARDDAYYDKVFAFAYKHNSGFHPMIYSKGIELWKDNFLWFQEMLAKHNMPWHNIYLLEVRNEEWTSTQTAEMYKFARFLAKWSVERAGSIPAFLDFCRNHGGFNILNSPFSIIGRGIGCSVQGMMYLRLGDLAWIPCHRCSYPGMEYAKLRVHNGKIVGFEAKNVEFLVSGYAFTADSQPMCEACVLKNSCSHGCLGAQFESTGDFFSPIPSVCALEHAKVLGILHGFKDAGIMNKMITRSSNEIKVGLYKLLDIWEDKR